MMEVFMLMTTEERPQSRLYLAIVDALGQTGRGVIVDENTVGNTVTPTFADASSPIDVPKAQGA